MSSYILLDLSYLISYSLSKNRLSNGYSFYLFGPQTMEALEQLGGIRDLNLLREQDGVREK